MSAKITRNAPTVLVVAGGSGGHIFPAISVIQVLRRARPSWHVVLLTTRHPRDQRALASVPEFLRDGQVHVECLPRVSTRPWGRLTGWPALWSAAQQALRVYQPQATLGFGGWLSVPVLLAARSRRVPVVIHEQNVQPGRANALLGWWASAIAVSFEETKRLWPQAAAKMTVTGNPIRFLDDLPSRATARQQWGVDEPMVTVLGMGGSGGATTINEALPAACAQLPPELAKRLQVIHLAGNQSTDHVSERYRAVGVSARVLPFLDQMASAYRAADVVVARAGASTVAELAHFGCPAIFVPYPYARGHQRSNARYVERAGAALVCEQNRRLVPRLAHTLADLLQAPAQLQAMSGRMQHVAMARAAERVAHTVLTIAEPATP